MQIFVVIFILQFIFNTKYRVLPVYHFYQLLFVVICVQPGSTRDREKGTGTTKKEPTNTHFDVTNVGEYLRNVSAI